MKIYSILMLIIFLVPVTAFAYTNGNSNFIWLVSLLVITQILVIVLNFKTKRSLKDKIILLVIYSFAMISPWQHFLTGGKNLYLYSAYLLLMQYLFYRLLLFIEKKIAESKLSK